MKSSDSLVHVWVLLYEVFPFNMSLEGFYFNI